MIPLSEFRQIALSLPGTAEAPHHDILSFTVHKKIFATLNPAEKRCTLKFDADYQEIFTTLGKGRIYRVPNAWGKHGWTTVELQDLNYELLSDAILIAWRCTAPKKFKKLYPDRYLDD